MFPVVERDFSMLKRWATRPIVAIPDAA